MVVERSIGQLKGRYRKLKMLDCTLPKSTDSVTFVAYHITYASQRETLNDEETVVDDNVNNGPGPQGIVESGNQKRNNLVQNL